MKILLIFFFTVGARISVAQKRIIVIPTKTIHYQHFGPQTDTTDYERLIDSTFLDLSYWYPQTNVRQGKFDSESIISKPNQMLVFFQSSDTIKQDWLMLTFTVKRRFNKTAWSRFKSEESTIKDTTGYLDSLYHVSRKPPKQSGGAAYHKIFDQLWLQKFDEDRLLKETSNYLSILCSFYSDPAGGKVYLIPTLNLSRSLVLDKLNKLHDAELTIQKLTELIPGLSEYLVTNDTPIKEIYLPEFEYLLIFEVGTKFKKRFFTPKVGDSNNNTVKF